MQTIQERSIRAVEGAIGQASGACGVCAEAAEGGGLRPAVRDERGCRAETTARLAPRRAPLYDPCMAGIFGSESVNEVARMLAAEHAVDDPAIQQIFLVPHADEVRLIEVTTSVRPDGEILPFRFAAGRGVPFRSVVIMVNPTDWERRTELEWPAGLDPTRADLEQLLDQRDPAA